MSKISLRKKEKKNTAYVNYSINLPITLGKKPDGIKFPTIRTLKGHGPLVLYQDESTRNPCYHVSTDELLKKIRGAEIEIRWLKKEIKNSDLKIRIDRFNHKIEYIKEFIEILQETIKMREGLNTCHNCRCRECPAEREWKCDYPLKKGEEESPRLLECLNWDEDFGKHCPRLGESDIGTMVCDNTREYRGSSFGVIC